MEAGEGGARLWFDARRELRRKSWREGGREGGREGDGVTDGVTDGGREGRREAAAHSLCRREALCLVEERACVPQLRRCEAARREHMLRGAMEHQCRARPAHTGHPHLVRVRVFGY